MRRFLFRMIWMSSAVVMFPAPEPGVAQTRPMVSDWQAPVAGPLLRPFHVSADPFAGGSHRGIDLAARPGAPVGATCAGTVAFAGDVAGARVVTLACGSWRVTHLPLSRLAVGSGHRVRRGQLLGSVAAASGHAGLHVGVRRAGRRFGYVDPWPLLSGATADAPGPIPVARRGRRPRVAPMPRGRVRALREPRAHPRRPVVASPRGVADGIEPTRPRGEERVGPLAPPPAWIGLAVLLLGVSNARLVARSGRNRLDAKEPAIAGKGAGQDGIGLA